jgi:hypothetical protein
MYISRQALAFSHCYKAPLSNLKTTLGKLSNLKTTLGKHLFPYRRAFLKIWKVHAVIHRKKRKKLTLLSKIPVQECTKKTCPRIGTLSRLQREHLGELQKQSN